MTIQSHRASWTALGANTPTPEGQPIPFCSSSYSSPDSELQEKWPHAPPHLVHPEMNALKADSSLCLTPSATGAALPAQALSPGPPPLPAPLTFYLLTCAAPGGGNGVGAQGLRCLNRYPSVLAGLAVAKTKTHHRDGTGCWGREMSKAGIRKRRGKGKERSEGRKRRRERKGRMWQGQRKDGGSRGE